MRLPKFRVRTLMVAVALVAVGMVVLQRRKDRFSEVALKHLACAWMIPVSIKGPGPLPNDYRLIKEPFFRWRQWHLEMAVKYEYAARYPWLPVVPDPPEPELSSPESVPRTGMQAPLLDVPELPRQGPSPFDLDPQKP